MYQILVTLLLINCVFVVKSTAWRTPKVKTDKGVVKGYTVGKIAFSHFAFKGIPYAEPPVGPLRFADPIPHAGWSEVRKAYKHGNKCPQTKLVLFVEGNEDCLFLNVYTPSLRKKLPVMVWIHGGSFSSGSGDATCFDPEYLVDQNVVVVTINYRLGALGFMSTGDRHAPGNYGLKDMQLALKWVQRNIAEFGGDPNSVTIFGESAGGVAVHLLILSPLSKGLFHRAISQSGSALNPWAFAEDPRSWAFNLAKTVGLTTNSTANVVAHLRNIPVKDIVQANPSWLQLQIPRGFSPMAFVPCIDPPDSQAPIFMPRHPRELMESGAFMHIPYIVGTTDVETLFTTREMLFDPSIYKRLNEDLSVMIPRSWNITKGSEAAANITQAFQNFYLKGKKLTAGIWSRFRWSLYTSDHHIGYGVDTTARLHAQKQKENVYFYIFSFVGSLNYVKRILYLKHFPGAVHGDDIPYLFKVPHVLFPWDKSRETRRRMIRLWTNFAKTGNPTSDKNKDVNVDWPPFGTNQEYLDIGNELKPGTHPNSLRMNLWRDLEKRYVKHIDHNNFKNKNISHV